MHGEPRTARMFEEMPVVVVAYSGGYLPAAWCPRRRRARSRLRGVVLLDALYGELETFASWIANSRSGFLVSAYTRSTGGNHTQLARMLAARNVTIESDLAQALRGGDDCSGAGQGPHRDLRDGAWAERPISDLLARLREYPRQPLSRGRRRVAAACRWCAGAPTWLRNLR